MKDLIFKVDLGLSARSSLLKWMARVTNKTEGKPLLELVKVYREARLKVLGRRRK